MTALLASGVLLLAVDGTLRVPSFLAAAGRFPVVVSSASMLFGGTRELNTTISI
jgi:hypothetical protein